MGFSATRGLRKHMGPDIGNGTDDDRLHAPHWTTRTPCVKGGTHPNWVLSIDIRGFFDAMVHGWLVRFIEHRIADRRIVRLIRKWLRAGVLEDDKHIQSEVGSPQGASFSPLAANIYLHYVFDLWSHQWRQRHA